MIENFSLIFLSFNLIFFVSSTKNSVQELYLKRERIFDQDKSGSGYIYQSPGSYVSLNSNPASLPYGIPVGDYVTHAPQNFLQPQPVYIPYAPVKPSGPYSDDSIVKYINPKPITNSNFVKKDGQEYNQADYSSHGNKGDNGYKSDHKFEKGVQGKHDNEAAKAYYDQHAGRKIGFEDKTGYHSDREATEHGSKGDSFHHANSHRKGSKTTGFHNVYHKDEYKKDHTFYDESDSHGHHDKYEKGHSEHAADSGSFKKGGHSDVGHHTDEHGKKGFYDKGHYLKNDQGYKGEEGQEQYHSNNEKYGQSDGGGNHKEYGYDA